MTLQLYDLVRIELVVFHRGTETPQTILSVDHTLRTLQHGQSAMTRSNQMLGHSVNTPIVRHREGIDLYVRDPCVHINNGHVTKDGMLGIISSLVGRCDD